MRTILFLLPFIIFTLSPEYSWSPVKDEIESKSDSLGLTGQIYGIDSLVCLNLSGYSKRRFYWISPVENATDYEWLISSNGTQVQVRNDTTIQVDWNSAGPGFIKCIPKNDSLVGDTATLNIMVSDDCILVDISDSKAEIGDTITVYPFLKGNLRGKEILDFEFSWGFDTSKLEFLSGKPKGNFFPPPIHNYNGIDTIKLLWESNDSIYGYRIDRPDVEILYSFDFLVKKDFTGDPLYIFPSKNSRNFYLSGNNSDYPIIKRPGKLVFPPNFNPCVMASDEPPGCEICGPIIIGRNEGFTSGPIGLDFPCGTIENNAWFSVIAGSTGMSATILSQNCTNGFGLELMIYDEELNPVSSCFSSGGSGFPGNVTASNLVPGKIYWIMIDGFNGDICDFTLTVTGGISTGPPESPGPILVIPNINPLCPGSVINYSVSPISNATNYDWEIPENSFFLEYDQNEIFIFFDSIGSGVVRLAPNNSCFPGAVSVIPVTVLPIPPTILPPKKFCEEEFPVTFEGIQFEEPGVFDTVFYSFQGCDSPVIYTIEAYEKIPFEVVDTICSNQTYTLPNGLEVDSSGFYEVILDNATSNDCDSIIHVQLTVAPSLQSSQSLSSCKGEVIYLPNGLEITQSGTYTVVLPSSGGCDSIITYDATFYPTFEIRDSVEICIGDSYLWQGQLLDAAGNYRADLQTENGCDSILRLNLSFYPEPAILDTIIIPDDGSGNGSIIFQISGDTSNYTFTWDNGATTKDLIGIPFGSYSLDVGYGDGCFAEFTFEVDRVSSVEGVLSDHGILVYPNPVGEYLNVDIRKAQSNIDKIEVLSVSGSLLRYQMIYAKETQVDLKGLAPGNYYLRLFGNDGEVMVRRFVKG